MPKTNDPEAELRKLSGKATPKRLDEDSTGDELLLYGTERGIRIEVRYYGETLWMTQRQMSDLFGVGVPAVNKQLAKIYEEGELSADGTISKMEIVASDGKRREVNVYNLDAIISVGYRISSKQATQFRIWATERLKEIILKGWSIDVERMKDPDNQDHFKELKETIRDIRASEANVYREVRGICAMCQDYDPKSEVWRKFYAGMQNRLLWAVTGFTGPELISSRADSKAENMGLTSWQCDNIRKHDVSIANNYLAEAEIKEKNRLTTMLLDYFEDQADQRRLVTMKEAEEKLCSFIKFNERPLLRHLGSVKKQDAVHKAEREYEIYKEKRRALRHQEG